MAVNEGEIGIYGVLRNDTPENILAKTDQLYDTPRGKTQEKINSELTEEIQNIKDTTLTPDEEDITAIDLKLQFKDRPNTDGMGYVICRANKDLVSQITQTNTIYEIRYNFDLDGGTLTVPNNCVLKFNGGSIGNGTLIGDNTCIDSVAAKIFSGITLSGTFIEQESYPEWFGAKQGNNTVDCSSAINSCLMAFNLCKLGIGKYYTNSTITLNKTAQRLVGSGIENSIIIPQSNDQDTILIDGSSCPAYRTHISLKEFSIVPESNKYGNQSGIKITKAADFFINKVRISAHVYGIYMRDTLIYKVTNSYIDKNDIAIYFEGRNELSANNISIFDHNVITQNNVAIYTQVGKASGSNIIFAHNEIEYNGHTREDVDDRPLIYLESSINSGPFVTFRDNWFENNVCPRLINVLMCRNTILVLDNNSIYETANTIDSFLICVGKDNQQGDTTGSEALVSITNTIDPTTYNLDAVDIKDDIRVISFDYNQLIKINNDIDSIVYRNKSMRTDLSFADSKGAKFISQGSNETSRVYSSSNYLILENNYPVDTRSGQWFGSSTANSYKNPFRIGNIWLFRDGYNLRAFFGDNPPSSSSDGIVLGMNLNYYHFGTTEDRPTLTSSDKGFEYYDTTLNKPIYWNGTEWVTWDDIEALTTEDIQSLFN